jgi:hypothetical protein
VSEDTVKIEKSWRICAVPGAPGILMHLLEDGGVGIEVPQFVVKDFGADAGFEYDTYGIRLSRAAFDAMAMCLAGDENPYATEWSLVGRHDLPEEGEGG